MTTRIDTRDPSRLARTIALLTIAQVIWSLQGIASAADPPEPVVEAIKKLSPQVFSAEQAKDARRVLPQNIRTRLRRVNDASSAAWSQIKNRSDWEAFRDQRLATLRESVRTTLPPPDQIRSRKTGEHHGDGFVIENLLVESRPGNFISANLYRPASMQDSMPGIVICHSHHRPKEQKELQDMGMTWARAGCLVFVPDLPGHGERGQHGFRSKEDYQGDFKWWRQDYYFRYDAGIQLHLTGESLMGWEVGDLMRSVDYLLSQDGIDPKRIILLGAVAGGGDPAAVTAALDTRIAGAAPFNFGGPQPETAQLPIDIEKTFGYAGSGGWESTRNLRRSARDGFLPWVIVGGIAPRKLIYAHEFRWDEERDPVWKRIKQIHSFYGQQDSATGIKGYGTVKQSSATASHCTNIGRGHRAKMHPWFKKWWNISVSENDEYSQPLPESKLRCLTPKTVEELAPKSLVELLTGLGKKHVAALRTELAPLSQKQRRSGLRQKWSQLLGPVAPATQFKVISAQSEYSGPAGASVERIVLETEPGIQVPLILFVPAADSAAASPLVIGVSQSGKRGFLAHRSLELARLLKSGAGVCLPDLRGTGETRAGDGRGKQSYDTGLSSSELMLGGTQVGARLRDLRSVLQYLRERAEFDADRISLWGDSFANMNSATTNFKVPRRVNNRPHQSEPLGGMLVLIAGLFEDQIHSVYSNQSLESFQSVLQSPFVYIPHDVVIPGALTAGDLADLAAAQAPRPLAFGPMVDGFNRRSSAERVQAAYRIATDSYRQADAAAALRFQSKPLPARWLIDQHDSIGN